ncbi:MAG: DedA family protein [Chitinophagales bacterium]
MNDILPQLIVYLREYGLWLLSLAIILQCNGIPTGANLMVMAAGAFSFAGELNIFTVSLTVLVSNVTGDLSGYFIWKYLGRWLFRKLPHLEQRLNASLKRTNSSFERYAFLTVVFTRFPISTLTPVINIMAGTTAYRLSGFIPADVIGEVMWTSFYLGIGYWFGDAWEEASALLSQFSQWLLLVVALIIVFYIFTKQIKRKDIGEDEFSG